MTNRRPRTPKCAQSPELRAQSAEAQTALRCPLEAGRASIEISAGNRTREVEIEVGPRARRDGPAPVVFLWHGGGGGPRRMLDALDLARTWPEAVAVAPEVTRGYFPAAKPLALRATCRLRWQWRSSGPVE